MNQHLKARQIDHHPCVILDYLEYHFNRRLQIDGVQGGQYLFQMVSPCLILLKVNNAFSINNYNFFKKKLKLLLNKL